MKKKLFFTASALLILATLSFGGIAAVFAAPRWFSGNESEENTVVVNSWIKVAVKSKDAFAASETLTVKFTVKQWAEDGNYKLILSQIQYFCEPSAEVLNPDYMWEHYSGCDWAPISEALNFDLIPKVDMKSHTAYLKIRVKPDVFLTAGFRKYLDYNLELTAALVVCELK